MDSCCKKETREKEMREESRKDMHEKDARESSSTNYVMTGLMIFLFLFSLGQAFQIAALDNVVESQASSGVSLLSTPLTNSGAPASKPAAAPTMVGGC